MYSHKIVTYVVTYFLSVASQSVPPIVIVPGLGGSVLEAKLHDKPSFRDCETESDWYTIWASLLQGMTRYDCFKQDLSLVTDGDGVANFTGVTIRPRDFGGTGGVEYSNAGTMEPPIAYMHAFISRLEEAGYEPNKTVRAATNDFRGAGVPEILRYQYKLLKNLVEETSHINGDVPVHLLSHSLGGPYTNLFLTSFVHRRWKSKYIASHIMLSAPLMGTPVAVEGIISGPMYDDVPQFLPEMAVPVIRSFPSIVWMFPRVLNKIDVWGKDQVFVSNPSKNYTLSNLKELVVDVNATVLISQWDRIQRATLKSANDPHVPVLCVYANDTRTDLSLYYPNEKFDAKGTKLETTWGDGTVNLVSLEVCNRWSRTTVKKIQFGGSLAAHTEIVQSPEVMSVILEWLIPRNGI